MNEYYKNAYQQMLAFQSEIEALISSKDEKALQALLYSALTRAAYPDYHDSMGIMSVNISFWSQSYAVKVQGKSITFRNEDAIKIQQTLNGAGISSAYFHVLVNSKTKVPNNRRIVINVANQEVAEALISSLVNAPDSISSIIREYKIYLTSKPRSSVKDDKIVIYYLSAEDGDAPSYFDSNGEAILNYLGEIQESISKFFPFYHMLAEGTAFGDEPEILPGERKRRSFSSIRCYAMAKGLIAYDKFPDDWQALESLLAQPFTDVCVDPKLPYLNTAT